MRKMMRSEEQLVDGGAVDEQIGRGFAFRWRGGCDRFMVGGRGCYGRVDGIRVVANFSLFQGPVTHSRRLHPRHGGPAVRQSSACARVSIPRSFVPTQPFESPCTVHRTRLRSRVILVPLAVHPVIRIFVGHPPSLSSSDRKHRRPHTDRRNSM